MCKIQHVNFYQITLILSLLQVATFEPQTMNIHSNDCLEDWLMAFDGDDQTVSPEDNIGHFCGYNIPPQITSTGNSQMLIFSSQWFSAPAGFSGRYSYAPGTFFFPSISN